MYLLFCLIPFVLSAKISALYLTISGPPTTAMTIQWHTTKDQTESVLFLQAPGEPWNIATGSYDEQEHILVHKVAFDNLIPNTEYSFRIGNLPKIYHFRTAPEDLNESFRFAIYSREKEFPSTKKAIARHLCKREMDLFAKDDFYYFPPYPPISPPLSIEEEPYPFREKETPRDACDKTRALFQKIYTPNAAPDALAKTARTAASGDQEKQIFHADQGTDYGGADKQELFDTFHQQSVFFVAQVLRSFTDPNDFSLYATLHAIALLKLRAAAKTGTGDLLQIGKWRAKGLSPSVFEDDPSPYTIVAAITPTGKDTRYHRYHCLMESMLYPGKEVICVYGNLEGTEIHLSNLWQDGIEHTSAIHTVKIIDYLENKIRALLGQEMETRSVLLKHFACIHWWLAQLMPFFRGSASSTEILIQSLAIAKGLPPPRLAGIPKNDPEQRFIFADLEAMYMPLETYIDQYESIIDSLQ